MSRVCNLNEVDERTRPEGSGLPVVVIMREASEARQAAVVAIPLPLLFLPFLLPSADLIVQLGLSVDVLPSLPAGEKREGITKARRKHDISLEPSSLVPVTTVMEDSEGTSRRASPIPGYDSLFTFMLKVSLQYFQFSLE